MATEPASKKLKRPVFCRTGNGSLINYNGNEFGAGAVGSHGALLRLILRKKMVILKVDPLTEEPARDKNGLCIRVRNAKALRVCESTYSHLLLANYRSRTTSRESSSCSLSKRPVTR